ncbi:MAG: carboxylesterase/lipase family protein [Acidimicrobiia bacterium]
MVLDGGFTLLGMVEIATPAGRLLGTSTQIAACRVHAYRGIPFATATRFAAPVRVPAWSRTRDATEYGPAAPQPVGGPLDGLVPGAFRGTTSEQGCLTLNVWTQAAPQATGRSGQRRPVLVWFPGGAFTIGASSQPVYDGTQFCAEQNVVFVTANYRLGALGFLDARGIGGVANSGLRDAIAALEWVHDNIEAFGGDPDCVTAFGESAGGGVVLHLCASPLARGLFGGAIVQSGATFNTLDETRATRVTEALVAELGLADAAVLTEVPVEQLIQAQAASALALLPTVGMMPFHPMVDGDVLVQTPLAAFDSGAAADVALVIGTTTDEMRLFVDLSGPGPPRDRLCSRVARYAKVDASRAAEIVATYETELGTNDSNEVWAAVFTDVEMQRPAAALRDAHRAHGPTYSYLFGWPAAQVRLGACHGIDIPFTFGNFVDGWAEFVGVDDTARRLGKTLRDAWTAFAHTGDPGWPTTPSTMTFDRDPAVVDDPLRARLASLTLG